MEDNNLKLIKNAILNTLKYLKQNEPKCICEQCNLGYQYNKESLIKCEQRRKEIKNDHDIWESKILHWKERLKNAK